MFYLSNVSIPLSSIECWTEKKNIEFYHCKPEVRRGYKHDAIERRLQKLHHWTRIKIWAQHWKWHNNKKIKEQKDKIEENTAQVWLNHAPDKLFERGSDAERSGTGAEKIILQEKLI